MDFRALIPSGECVAWGLAGLLGHLVFDGLMLAGAFALGKRYANRHHHVVQ